MITSRKLGSRRSAIGRVFVPSLIAFVSLLAISCQPSSWTSHQHASLPQMDIASSTFFTPRHERTDLSFSFAPMANVIADVRNTPARVAPVSTSWGSPWDRENLCRVMDRILEENGIDNPEQRVRMIAHSIVASGWRQNVWNHNAWGVRQGSWEGPYYIKSTLEEDDDGNRHVVWDAKWRSFDDWKAAVDDFKKRINADSGRPSYRQAYRHLTNSNKRADAPYWEALGDGNYYTATHFSKKTFTQLCWTVRSYL